MRLAARRFLAGKWAEPAGIVLVTALVLTGSIAEAYPSHHYAGLVLRSHPSPAWFLLLCLPAVGLLWRRSHPVEVYSVAVAVVAAWAASGQVYGAALVVVLVAYFFLAVSSRAWPTVVLLGAVGSLAIWLAGGLAGTWGWLGGPQLDMWAEMVAAGSVGAFVASRRRWKLSEALRQEQLEQARAEEIRQQVTSERLRIARELHDVVAHSMAMINVQATAAATLVDKDAARVAESLQAIRAASKDGLRELRSILDVLRQVDAWGPQVPLPDGGGLAALAEAARSAGISTAFSCEVDLSEVAPQTALAIYRIVQESLTNIVRHAMGSAAKVVITGGDGRIVVDVADDGAGTTEVFAEGAGTGLAGMAERARALGGYCEAGPAPAGGFRVHAVLPMAPPPRADEDALPSLLGL